MGQEECKEILGEIGIKKGEMLTTIEELSEFRDKVIQNSKGRLKSALIDFIRKI